MNCQGGYWNSPIVTQTEALFIVPYIFTELAEMTVSVHNHNDWEVERTIVPSLGLAGAGGSVPNLRWLGNIFRRR